MNARNALMLAGAGVGAWWLFSKLGAGMVSAPVGFDDVGACLKAKPNWTYPQCQTRINELKAAAANATTQLAQILAPRAAFMAAGNMAEVARIDAAAAPWQAALASHRQDYQNLTGQVLA